MIEAIHLINYENHADSFVKFAPGTNIFQGPSDHGKSAIRRALSLVVFNRPVKGRPLDKTKDSSATLYCSGLPAITRGRTGGENEEDRKNYYKLRTDEVVLAEFKAFGTKVPEEISGILDIVEDNIQKQADQYYLLQNTPGQVAKKLHEILGMELVDKTNQIVSKMISSQTTLYENLNVEIKNIKQEIEKYTYLDPLEEKIGELETLNSKYGELTEKIQGLASFFEQCRELRRRMDDSELPKGFEALVKELKNDVKIFDEQDEYLQNFWLCLARIGKVDKKIEEFGDLEPLKKEIKDLQFEVDDFMRQKKILLELSSLIVRIEGNQRDMASVESVLIQTAARRTQIEEKIKLCPVCKKPFKETK